jgi:hypothetical protein
MNMQIYARNSCCQFICGRFPGPREQLVDSVDRVIGDARDDVAQIGFWVEPVEFGSLCRSPNYAERFWNQLVVPAHLRAVEQSASRGHSA